MLGIRCPDRHALPRFTSSKTFPRRRALPPARAGSFIGATSPLAALATKDRNPPNEEIQTETLPPRDDSKGSFGGLTNPPPRLSSSQRPSRIRRNHALAVRHRSL